MPTPPKNGKIFANANGQRKFKMTNQESALLRLLEQHSYRRVAEMDEPDLGLAEHRPFPFMAIVGQLEMRTALLLAVINPAIGGVLLIGPRGIAKTTAVRSITGILPHIEVSDCEEDVLPEDLEALEPAVAEALYPDCYEKYKNGELQETANPTVDGHFGMGKGAVKGQ